MKKEFVCIQCQKTFSKSQSHKNWIPKFCSKSCYGLSLAKLKKCRNCNKEFYNWQNKFFCSMECSGLFKRGSHLSNSHKEALSKARKGRFNFDKHPQWKGDDVGYGALHEWVYRSLGEPMNCQSCGLTKENNKQIHWANKSGLYLRDHNDWIRLCVKCHKRYDLERINNGGIKLADRKKKS